MPLTRDGGELRVLVGKRHPRSRFLGGFFAFPGGAHEPEDGDLAVESEDVCLRRTGSRELEEETGLVARPEDLLDAGRRITPPFGGRRFDSLMYVSRHATAEEPAPLDPGELLDMHWTRAEALVERWRALEIRIAPPLIPMLLELAKLGDADDETIAARLLAVNTDMEADGPRIEFVPDVLTMLLETPTLPPATHTNCYFAGRSEFLIIDPGAGDPREIDRVARHADRRAREGGTAKAIVLTHHHGDHVAGAYDLARRLGLPVWAHADTWARWPGGQALRDAEGARNLEDGQEFGLDGGERFRALLTPGHAAGHLALHEETCGSLFSGDLVSGASTILVDSAPGSMSTYLESLERIRDVGARTLFPGHGFPFIHPAKGVQRVIDHRLEREAKVLAALDDGALGLTEITTRAYADTPQANPGLAASQAAAHLERLVDLGQVRSDGSTFSRA